MKVIFGGETKRIPEIKEFNQLLNHASKVFNASELAAKNAKLDLKLFYQDDEGDIISVTCQSDLEEAYRSVAPGKPKLVFAKDEETARLSLNKGQSMLGSDSFFRSEYMRPLQQSMMDRSSFSQLNSDFSPMNPRAQMMGTMFEAFLQNQIECVMRQRSMTGTSNMFADMGTLPISDKLEGGLPEAKTPPIESAALENIPEEKVNDVSRENIDEIVRELDQEAPAEASNAAAHTLEEPNITETIDDATKKSDEAVAKKTCNCDAGDLCFKCILSKVFSLEPLLDQNYQAICIGQPKNFTGVAGADFSSTCTFKNTGATAWPANVLLKLVNGTNIVYNSLGLENQCVQPNEELNVTIDLKLPFTPGKYILNLRLVHGESKTEFGDQVSVNLLAQADIAEQVGHQEISQASNIPNPINYQVLPPLEEPAPETDGDNTFYVGDVLAQDDEDEEEDVEISEESGEDDEPVREEDNLSVDSWENVEDVTFQEKKSQSNDKQPSVQLTKVRENLFSMVKVAQKNIERNLLSFQQKVDNKIGDSSVAKIIEQYE